VSRAWAPPALALAVGDRVRVRLSGECRSWIHDKRTFGSECECGQDGDEGVVEIIHDDPQLFANMGAAEHLYFVEFGRCRTAGYGHCASSFARIELDRLA
jgi:hypothetical protein